MIGRTLLTAALLAAGAAAASISEELGRMAIFPRVSTANLQTFSGSLGGIKADAITDSGDPVNPFAVDGTTFNNFDTAANRACDNQHNSCADAANKGGSGFTVGQCDTQNTACKAAIKTQTTTAFNSLFSSNADFDIFCDI